MMKQNRMIAHKVLSDANRKEWDTCRKYYEIFSINDLILINMGIDVSLRKQKCRATEDVIEVLEELYIADHAPFNVVELGCHKGFLANEALKHFPRAIKSWVGYDINYYALEDPVCKDGRYGTVKQTEWFWNVEFFNSPNVFISTSTLEHHNEEQFLKIIEKVKRIPSIKHIAIGLPVRPQGWEGYGGSHILEMDQEAISQAIESAGFEIFFNKKRAVRVWGASR